MKKSSLVSIGTAASGFLVGWNFTGLWITRTASNPALSLALIAVGVVGWFVCAKVAQWTRHQEWLESLPEAWEEVQSELSEPPTTPHIEAPAQPVLPRPTAPDPTRDKLRGPD